MSYNTAAANRATARLVETGIGGALNPANGDLAPPGDSKGAGAGAGAKKAGRRKAAGGGGTGKEGEGKGNGKGAAEGAGAGGHAEKKKKPAAAVSSITLFAILANLTPLMCLSMSRVLHCLQLDNRAFTSDISPYELTLPDLHRGQRRHQAMADAAKVGSRPLSLPPRPPIARESRLLTRSRSLSLSGDLRCAALVVVVGVCRGGQRK